MKQDQESIKLALVPVTLKSPEKIQLQLLESINIIALEDFPKNWTQLLPNLIQEMQTNDIQHINKILTVVQVVLKRFRNKFGVDEVLIDLKYVLDLFQAPLLVIFQSVTGLIQSNASNEQALKSLFSSAKILAEIFYSLNYVDLPEYFEDNMDKWFGAFQYYLNFPHQFASLIGDEDEEGILVKVKAVIIDNLSLYMEKYDDEFQSYAQPFLQIVCNLLYDLPHDQHFDKLVIAGIRYLTTVSTSVSFRLFQETAFLQRVCENIAIKNSQLREVDETTFEDSPIEYIRRDLSTVSEVDTRRRASTELVKGLRRNYEKEVTFIFSGYINQMLANYQGNPELNWKSKEGAIYILTALAVNSSTASLGVTNTNPLIPILPFYQNFVLPELQEGGYPQHHPMIHASSLKFTSVFRNQLPKEAYSALFPIFLNIIRTSDKFVVSTYAAYCIERFLTVKEADGSTRFGQQELKPYLQVLFTDLFNLLDKHLKEKEENDYVLKTLMRVVVIAKGDLYPSYYLEIIKRLTQIIIFVSKNPTNPLFNHYLFETFASLISSLSAVDINTVPQLESSLFPVFQDILQQDVAEFIPYVIQLLGLLLEQPTRELNPLYTTIFNNFIDGTLWNRTGNLPALVRFIQAYLRKSPNLPNPQLNNLLIIFQRLISASSTDHEGFLLLEAMIELIPLPSLDQYLSAIFSLIFGRLTSGKTLKFIRSFLIFFCLFIGKHGAPLVYNKIQSIQNTLFMMILESLLIPNIEKVEGFIERKICTIGLTKILTEVPALTTPETISKWFLVLDKAISITTDKAVTKRSEEEGEVYGEGFELSSTAYSPLVYGSKEGLDPFKGVDPKNFFFTTLDQFCIQKEVRIDASKISENSYNNLKSYFVSIGKPQPFWVV
eukprot:TRINITY_DN15208_c0_g1_i1.p1 TRINITY_DN15208_c0_g1~~TRINITY_DN15208_c0_g1_i1.p1  ORF type:complete len:985 (+),score=144.61 TRINITY_DN15208_c0_g1_i1:290-2956(+)